MTAVVSPALQLVALVVDVDEYQKGAALVRQE